MLTSCININKYSFSMILFISIYYHDNIKLINLSNLLLNHAAADRAFKRCKLRKIIQDKSFKY